MRKLLLIVLLVVFSQVAMAAKLAGAYIEFRWNPNALRYDFTLYVYKDCLDNDRMNEFEMLKVRLGPTGSQIDEFRVDRVPGSAVDLGNICPQQQAQSSCRGGSIPSVEKYTYRGSYVLPAPNRASNWVFYWNNTQLQRADGINGVTGSASGTNSIYVESTLNNLNGERSSVTFTTEPNFFVSPNQTSSINHGASDDQGNRISYRQVPIRNGVGSEYAYNSGFSPSNPIGANFWQINARGTITVIPGGTPITGSYAVKAGAQEEGIEVTSVTRDITIYNREDPNINPTLEDATGANIFGGDTIVYCYPYGPQTFNIPATNPEASQIVSVNAPDDIQRLLPGAVVTNTPGTTGTLSITWTPESAGVIRLLVTAKDGSCPREGISRRIYVVIVKNPLQVVLPQNSRVACDRDIKVIPSSVRFGTPPYTFSWTALDGSIQGPTDQPNAIVNGVGTYTLQATDRYGCSSIGGSQGRDTANVVRAFGFAWFTAFNQPYNCFNLQVPQGCQYEGCVNTPLTFRYLTRFPSDVQGSVIPESWQWSFGKTKDLQRGQPETDYLVSGRIAGTNSQTDGINSWSSKGSYRIKVCYTARVVFESDTNTCDFCDSINYVVYRKPDLLPIRIDSCKGESYTFYNDATGRETGRFDPAKPLDTLECRPEFQQIYKMNVWRMNYTTLANGTRVLVDSTNVFTTDPWGNPGQPPNLQPSCDTIRFTNPQSLDLPDADFGNPRNPPTYRFWIRATNPCGDSLAFYESSMFCRPVFWPEFTTIPEPRTPNVTWNQVPRGCPVPVAPVVTSVPNAVITCSPGPYIWSFKGSLFPEDTISGTGFYNTNGEYEITAKDTNGCTFKKKFEIISDVVLTRILARPKDCNQPNCYKFNSLVSGNAVGNTAIRTIYHYGDGVIDTVDASDPDFRARINENEHCYNAPGTYSYKMVVYSIANPVFPDGICVDSITISVFVDLVVPRGILLDSTLCNLGGNYIDWEPLVVDAPYGPGIQDWVLYYNLEDRNASISKRLTSTGNGRLITSENRRPGKYKAVLVTNLVNGCALTDTFNFELSRPIVDKLDLAIQTTSSNCYPGNPLTYFLGGDSLQLLGAIVNYRWEFGQNPPEKVVIGEDSSRVTFQFASERPQTITLTVTDSLGCTTTLPFELGAPDFPPIALTNILKFNGEPDPLCLAETRTFNIPPTGRPKTIGTISWDITGPENYFKSGGPSDTSLTRQFNIPGDYTVNITITRQDSNNCVRTGKFNFSVYDKPKASLVVNRPCEGNPVILNGLSSIPGFRTDTIVNYEFSIVSGPSAGPSFNGRDSIVTFNLDVVGDYVAKLIVTTKNGCKDSITTTFRVRPRPVASFTYADQGGAPEVQAQAPIVFTSTSTDATSRIRVYDWNFGDGTDTSGARISKTYERANIWQVIHTVTNEENCTASDTQLVDLKAYMLFPTAFTPNGDGLNDRFRLITRGLDRVLEYRIYNRWGEEVFNGGTNRAAAWDGTINGSNSPSGIYIIRASGITIYGEQLTVDGRIVLIR